MKRILSILLFIAIMAQSLIMATAATQSISSVQSDDAVSFLQAFNIMYADKDNPEDAVTREKFALYIGRMLKIKESAAAEKRYFNDLAMDGYATGVINSLSDMGIVSRGDDNMFRPTEYITANEALKMLLCVLGYGDYCEVMGGFPYGYMSTAVKLGLTVSGEKITVNDAARIIFEAMQMPMYVAYGYAEDMANYSLSQNQTILSTYWDILFTKGTADAVYTGTLGKALPVDEGEISVNGKLYDLADGVIADEFFASYVKIFYTEETEDVIYIVREKCEEDIVFKIEDFIGLEGNTIRYYNSDRQNSITLDKMNLIYNGMPLGTKLSDTLKNRVKGTVTIKDSDNDDKYDVIIIEDYSTFIVASTDSKQEKIFNELDSKDNIEYSDYKNIRIITASGRPETSAAIKKGSVLSVAKSQNKEILKILIADNSSGGVLSQIKSKSDKLKDTVIKGFDLCIDDVWYTVDKQYAVANKTALENGLSFNQEYMFMTDAFGDIVYLERKASDAGELGYIMAVRDEGMFDKDVFLKLLTADGTIKVFSVYEKLKVDGTAAKITDKATLETAIKDKEGNISQLVRYVAQDDVIKLIDTQNYVAAAEDENNTLIATYGSAKNAKFYSSNRLGIRGNIDANTIAFCVPYNTAAANDEDYGVYSNTQVITNNGTYYADAYRLQRAPGIAAAMVLRYEDSSIFKNYRNNQKTFLIEEISETIDDDGDIVTLVSGYEDGVKKEYKVDPAKISFDNVEKGDLIKFGYDIHGNPATISAKLFDIIKDVRPDKNVWTGIVEGKKSFYRPLLASGSPDVFHLSFGYAAEADENVVVWSWDGNIDLSVYEDEDKYESANCSAIPVIIIEKGKTDVEIYRGKADDIVTYKDAGPNCSRVIYQSYTNTGRAMYVYK